MDEITLLAETGDAAIDRTLRGLVMAFEASFPGRVRGYYLLGSYADGGAVAISDIDLAPLFTGTLDAQERARAEQLADGCALLCPTRLDIVACDEATANNEVVLIQHGGLLLYGRDTRADLTPPPLPLYTRETLDAARHFMSHILRGLRDDQPLTYPLAYPDPDGEFFGYDTIHIPEWYPPETTHGVKELVTTGTRLARAHLALRAGRYTGSKGGSVVEYRDHIGDEWSDLLAALYQNGKLRWGYAVPTAPADRRLLRDLCQRMLAFENDFLARYRVYLLELLRSGDAQAQAHARAKLAQVIYPGDETSAPSPNPSPLRRERGARSTATTGACPRHAAWRYNTKQCAAWVRWLMARVWQGSDSLQWRKGQRKAMAVQFGVFVPQGWRMDLTEISDPVEQYEAMTRVARLADATPQLDSIWLYDHFHTVPTPELQSVFEVWTSTAGLARDTQRINIGQMVTCNGYRNPALLAKMASTVDVMSHGRLYFGLGAGWYEHEWHAYGYGFPETRERMRAFREACGIVMQMWTEDYPEFKGEYYTIDKPINEPKGARKPHPSFWIGGGGEQVTLKLVAKYGNACNVGGDNETIRHKFDVLRGHCEALGRDYDAIIRSSTINVYPIARGADPEQATAKLQQKTGMSLAQLRQGAVIGDADAISQHIEGLLEAGVNYVLNYIPRIAYEQEPFQILTEAVLPRFK